MTGLDDRVSVITGAAGNLGQATAAAFIEGGACTVLVDRGRGRLQKLYAQLAESANGMLAEGVDVAEPEAMGELVNRVVERFGRIDVLVNTVGTYRGGTAVHEEELETWDLLMRANLRTALVACRAVIPVMLKGRGGRIVNVAARSALSAGANSVPYAASKSAVVRLTEGLAAEHRASNIRANCVLP
ncbi:MAG: SDR family NAD(P)-dependent oxidoreductase, partial [Gemmatimonadetes bacterium]|nr:SDR family NAD(P)-dependent oxidoreductase [Gemmatimonadota bacterium]NIR75634.1 SDR family NAD(P)-dependent oxidoreductase [Candidatus Kutchimonas denitrificans]NIS02934.1 SDR family NAD(P)-dependent oxidoreductase [Gemmatimonadota bacterium]NIT68656.1 SDR family NAD(P)-dependent oxidoreductase [Gemmatimonadota bacterium]NIV25335.1 SDR family NAD(P)-dependent oxidoreductase [Gemmatimonadota bacterium]